MSVCSGLGVSPRSWWVIISRLFVYLYRWHLHLTLCLIAIHRPRLFSLPPSSLVSLPLHPCWKQRWTRPCSTKKSLTGKRLPSSDTPWEEKTTPVLSHPRKMPIHERPSMKVLPSRNTWRVVTRETKCFIIGEVFLLCGVTFRKLKFSFYFCFKPSICLEIIVSSALTSMTSVADQLSWILSYLLVMLLQKLYDCHHALLTLMLLEVSYFIRTMVALRGRVLLVSFRVRPKLVDVWCHKPPTSTQPSTSSSKMTPAGITWQAYN